MTDKEEHERTRTTSATNDEVSAAIHKILLVGGSGVGKTSILKRFVDGEFPTSNKPTLGLDFRIRTIQLKDKTLKLQLWDTSGQERFRSMTQSYYRGATGVFLVYDVTDDDALKSLLTWKSDIQNYAPEDTDIILLANKTDLTEERVISREAGEEFARHHGDMVYIETSAVQNENIREAFQNMAETVSSKEAKHKDTVVGLMQQLSNDQVTQPENTSDCRC